MLVQPLNHFALAGLAVFGEITQGGPWQQIPTLETIFGSEQEFDERQAGMTFSDGRISVHSAVCETAT